MSLAVGAALLERATELSRLEAAGLGKLVLVAGEAGVGKTTLVRHFPGRPVRKPPG